uniref:C3H1-type domain-containing protein n=1 Tax=Panagrellus redivivus TaxID=6233 RepID=A0A7E4VAZ1_PANRE
MQSYPDNSLESNYYDQQNPQQQPSQQQPRIGALPPASSFFDNSPSSTEFHGNLDAGPSSSSGFAGMNTEFPSNFNADPFFAGPSPGYMGHDPFAYHHDHQGYGRSMEMGYNHGPSHLNMNMMYDSQMPYGNDYIGPTSGEQNPAMLTPLTGMPSVPPASQYVDPYAANDMYQQPYPSQPTNLDGSGNIYGQTDAGRSMYPPGPPPQQGQMYPMASEPMNYPRIPDMAPPYMEMQAPPMPQQMPRPPQTPQTVPSTPVTEKPVEQPPPTPVSAPIPASTPVEPLKPVDTTIEDTVAEVVAQQTAPRAPPSTSPKTSKPKKRRYVRSFESIVDQMNPHPDPADGPTVKQHLQKQQLEKRMQEQAARKASKAKMEEEKRAAAVAEAVALGRPPPLMPPKRTRKKKAPADKKKESPEVINLDTSDVEILEQPSAPPPAPTPQQAEVQVQEVVIDEPAPAEVLQEELPPESPKPKPKPKRARKPAAKRETAAQKRERLHYLHKAHHMQISMKSLVLKNTALADEVSRLFYRIQAATEERKRLAKQLQQYERNRMRRLQTQKKKQALAAATASPEHVFHEYQDYEGGEAYSYPPPAPSEPLFDVEEYPQEQEVVQQPEPSMSPVDPNATAYPYEYFEPMPMQVVFRTFDVTEADLSGFPGQHLYRPHQDQPLDINVKTEEPAKPKRVRKPRAPKDPNAPPKKRQRRSKTAVAEEGAEAAASADAAREDVSVSGSVVAVPNSESLPLPESVPQPEPVVEPHFPEPDQMPQEAAPASINAPESLPTPKPAPEPEHNPTEEGPI